MLADYLRALLSQQKDSELARHLRHDLCGLHASLEEALQRARQNDDPGGESCAQLIDELKQLLQQPTSSKKEMSKKDNFDLSTSEFKLKDLRDQFLKDESLRKHLDKVKFSTNDRDFWNEIQLLLLRVSEQLAKKWQDRVHTFVQEIGAKADESAVTQLSYREDKLLYPGLAGAVQAKGLHLLTKAPLDKRVAEGKQDGDLKFLGQVVSICLQFVEMDPFLQHCLRDVYSFGITPLDSPKKKSDYTRELISRFQHVQKCEDYPVKSLYARLDLDEAIHSLVYLPLVKSNSWWNQLQDEARKTLRPAVERVNNAGGNCATHQWLLGDYKNVIRHTQSGSRGNFGLENYGTPGKILVCLRVYAQIDGNDSLGRVIYSPFK